MIYSTTRIVRDCRLLMRRTPNSRQLIHAPDDVVTTDQCILAQLPAAVAQVHFAAPAEHLCEVAHSFSDAGVYWDSTAPSDSFGHVLLPADFMRLLSFRMTDWDRPATALCDTGSLRYAMAQTHMQIYHGSCHSPVCFVRGRPEGMSLEFRACRTPKARISEAMYVPVPFIDAAGGVEIASRCYHDVIALIAERVR